MNITDFVTTRAQRYEPDDDALPTADHDQMRDALAEVRQAAQQVLAADLSQSQQAVADIAREYPVMQNLVGYLVAEAERTVRAELLAAIDGVQEVADERLRAHAPVPERLEAQRDEAQDKARQLGDMVDPSRDLPVTDGWEGEAAQAYHGQANLQVAAFEEFVGLNLQAAGYLDEAALLHRATFAYCAASLRITATRITLLQSADPGHLFARTRQAIALLNAAASQLGHDVDSFQRGAPAHALARGMEALIRTTSTLTDATWPSTGGNE